MIDELLLLYHYRIFFGFLDAHPSPGRAGLCFCNYVDPAIRAHVKIHRLETVFVSPLSTHQSERECSIWRRRDILMEEPKYRRIKSLCLGTATCGIRPRENFTHTHKGPLQRYLPQRSCNGKELEIAWRSLVARC